MSTDSEKLTLSAQALLGFKRQYGVNIKMEISAKTKLLAIIGDPVGHSRSPQMQTEFCRLCGYDAVYTAFEVTPDKLGGAIDAMRALGIRGFNVTSPHKYNVLKYLDRISDEAALYGAVNTVVNDNGILTGYNTDARGFYRSLERNNIEIAGKDVLIFGAGGATQPVAVLFAKKGVRSLTVINRSPERAQRLADYVRERTGFSVDTERKREHYDVVINTTTAGMGKQKDVLPSEDIAFIDENTACVDMIYNPWETRFLHEASLRGAKTLNGLGMLIYQGIFAFEHFSGEKLPGEAYEIAERAVLL